MHPSNFIVCGPLIEAAKEIEDLSITILTLEKYAEVIGIMKKRPIYEYYLYFYLLSGIIGISKVWVVFNSLIISIWIII